VAHFAVAGEYHAHPCDVLRARLAGDGDACVAPGRRRAGDGLPPGGCHYSAGEPSHGQACAAAKNLLGYVGVNPERLGLLGLGLEAPRFVQVTKTFTQKIRELGPFAQEVTE
jgi:coenzyme F420-reducing hydrogenase delta subunit